MKLYSLFTLIVYFVVSNTTFSCSCSKLGSPQERFNKSKFVFSGTVLSETPIKTHFTQESHSFIYEYTYEVDVHEVWKGIIPSQITLKTGFGGGDCGYRLKVGRTFLSFYRRYEAEANTFWLNSCNPPLTSRSKTSDFPQLQKPIAIYNKHKPPILFLPQWKNEDKLKKYINLFRYVQSIKSNNVESKPKLKTSLPSSKINGADLISQFVTTLKQHSNKTFPSSVDLTTVFWRKLSKVISILSIATLQDYDLKKSKLLSLLIDLNINLNLLSIPKNFSKVEFKNKSLIHKLSASKMNLSSSLYDGTKISVYLNDSKLNSSILTNSIIINSAFDKSNFQQTSVNQTVISSTMVFHSNLSFSSMINSRVTFSDFLETKFDNMYFENSLIIRCRFKDNSWNNTSFKNVLISKTSWDKIKSKLPNTKFQKISNLNQLDKTNLTFNKPFVKRYLESNILFLINTIK